MDKFQTELNKVPIEWDLHAGTFTFFGIPSALFWINPSLFKMLEPLANEIGYDLFKLSIAHSSSLGTDEDYHAMIEFFADNFSEGFLEWGKAVGVCGWGRFELPHIDFKKGEATVIVHNTWELKIQEHLKGNGWGCPFIQGKIIGIFNKALGINCWAYEEKIHIEGDKSYVIFKIKPSEKTIQRELRNLRLQKAKNKEKDLIEQVKKRTIQLEEAQIKLKEYSLGLETKVEKRTEELRNTIKELDISYNDLKIEKEKSEVASKAKSKFLSHMSHEIRTPLNAIIGFTEVLKYDNPDHETIEKNLDSILYSANHLNRIIKDILDISKIEQGKINIHKTHFDLQVLLNELDNNTGKLCREKGLKFNINIANNTPKNLYSDESKLNQILLNICNNAYKFTEKGSINIYIKSTKTLNETHQYQFKISDTGRGIPADKIDSIFKNFTQLDYHPQTGGTGLGLSITKQLIKHLNGNIEVESTKEKGSTFLITIPLISPTEKITTTSTEFNLSNTNANILIIEDNELNQLLIKQLLKPISGNKDFVYTAEDALKKIYTNSYDIIISDIQLPGMSGLEMIHHIYKNTPLFNTPIIVITADVSEELNETIKKINNCEIITKPIQRIELNKILFNKLK